MPKIHVILKSLIIISSLPLVVFAISHASLFHRGSSKGGDIIGTADLELRSFETVLESYKEISGRYPTEKQGLIALVKKPEINPLPERWIQLFRDLELDPWDSPYRYHYPGKQNPNKPEIISAGPDRQFGTEDDLSNQD